MIIHISLIHIPVLLPSLHSDGEDVSLPSFSSKLPFFSISGRQVLRLGMVLPNSILQKAPRVCSRHVIRNLKHLQVSYI